MLLSTRVGPLPIDRYEHSELPAALRYLTTRGMSRAQVATRAQAALGRLSRPVCGSTARTPSKAKLDVMLEALGSNRAEFEALLAARPWAAAVEEDGVGDATAGSGRGRDELLELTTAPTTTPSAPSCSRSPAACAELVGSCSPRYGGRREAHRPACRCHLRVRPRRLRRGRRRDPRRRQPGPGRRQRRRAPARRLRDFDITGAEQRARDAIGDGQPVADVSWPDSTRASTGTLGPSR